MTDPFATAKPGDTITLTGTVGPLVIGQSFSPPIAVNAASATVKGLTITGGGVNWTGGTIEAAGDPSTAGPVGYGLLIRNGHDVTVSGATFTSANRGLVLDGAKHINISGCTFYRVSQDCIIANNSQFVNVIGNTFTGTIGKPTECVINGATSYGLSSKDCVAKGGVWTDGYHCDAVQMRNNCTDWLIERNIVSGPTQGIDQMDSPTDAPLARIIIRHNAVITDGYHHITLGPNAIDCRIENNLVARADGSTKKAIIIAGAAMRCGNIAPDDRIHDAPCQ